VSTVVPVSQAVPLRRARANSWAAGGYPTRSTTTTIPTSNDGCLDFTDLPPQNFKILPFGQGTGGTFNLRIIGWMLSNCLPSAEYMPVDLFEGSVTLGTATGTGTGVAASTIASGSNGLTLPNSTIALASTTGFATSGIVLVATSLGVYKVAYTGISGNALTGCNQNVPELMGTGTMSTGAPVIQANGSGNAVTSSDLFATSITGSVGNAGVDYDAVSPGNNQIAHLVLQNKGCSFVEVLFDLGTATAANALVGPW
jgi:hypothetical protein